VDKGCFVADIKNGDQVEGLFLVRDMVQSETKAGKPFLTLTLMDRTGQVVGRVWDNALNLAHECASGNIIHLKAQAQSYKDLLQLKVIAVQAQERGGVDWSMFMPSTPYNISEMAAEMREHLRSVSQKNIRALLLSFVNDQNFMKEFCQAPAAKNMHHAYIGGLLEHTLGVVRLAVMCAEAYEQLDRSLLVCGAFLHDIGKIKEFSYETPPFDYSSQGRLLGHMVLAVEMIQGRLDKMADFPEELASLVKHLVLSHHGKYEFGSPALPMIRESFVLNFIDDLDAKMNYMDRVSEDNKGEGYAWSSYQRMFERFLFLPGSAARKEQLAAKPRKTADKREKGDSGKQPTLWG